MISPVKRFSRISLPARPTARPPTPPMASTEFTAVHSTQSDTRRVPRLWMHCSAGACVLEVTSQPAKRPVIMWPVPFSEYQCEAR